MNVDAQTIDRIVVGVLRQLGENGDGAPITTTPKTHSHEGDAERHVSREALPSATRSHVRSIRANVITANVLIEALNGETQIIVPARAIITPAASDAAKERGIQIIRQSPRIPSRGSDVETDDRVGGTTRTHGAQPVGFVPLLIVVTSTDAVERVRCDLRDRWRYRLVANVDEAASLAISAICRGDASSVVILSEQSYRAACLLNRNDRVWAAPIADAGDMRSVRNMLRANAWCIDPTGKSWFELRNLMRALSDL